MVTSPAGFLKHTGGTGPVGPQSEFWPLIMRRLTPFNEQRERPLLSEMQESDSIVSRITTPEPRDAGGPALYIGN